MIDAPEFHDVKLKEYCTEASIDLKERTFAMFFATPFSGCGLLAPLSFFLMFFKKPGDRTERKATTSRFCCIIGW